MDLSKQNLGLLSLAFMLSLGGCRFGNHSEDPTIIPGAKTFVHSELFSTEPNRFEVRAILDNSGSPQILKNEHVALSAAPSNVLNTFSNPHYYRKVNNADSTPIFENFNEDSYFITKVIDEDQTIAYDSDEGFEPTSSRFMYNANCRTHVKLITEGNLDRSNPRTIDLGGGESITIAGRSHIAFTNSQSIWGDCAEDLQILAYCYANGAGCSADELRFSHQVLDLYVNQSGVLNVNDVVKLKGLEYTVYFE